MEIPDLNEDILTEIIQYVAQALWTSKFLANLWKKRNTICHDTIRSGSIKLEIDNLKPEVAAKYLRVKVLTYNYFAKDKIILLYPNTEYLLIDDCVLEGCGADMVIRLTRKLPLKKLVLTLPKTEWDRLTYHHWASDSSPAIDDYLRRSLRNSKNKSIYEQNEKMNYDLDVVVITYWFND